MKVLLYIWIVSGISNIIFSHVFLKEIAKDAGVWNFGLAVWYFISGMFSLTIGLMLVINHDLINSKVVRVYFRIVEIVVTFLSNKK